MSAGARVGDSSTRRRPASSPRAPGPCSTLVLAEAGDDVAQRGELGGDRVAALGHPVDLGPEAASSRSASASPDEVIESAWVRAEATICSASRRARVSSASDSVCACWRCVGRLGEWPRGRAARRRWRAPRPPRPGAGSRRWRWCGGRWPPWPAAPSRPRACGGPPGPRGRRRRGPARPRAWRWSAARWSPAGRPGGSGRPRAWRRPAGPRPRPGPGVRSCSASASSRARVSSSSWSWTRRMSSASRAASARIALASRVACSRISAASRSAAARTSSASSSASRSIALARPPSPAYDGVWFSASSRCGLLELRLELEHALLGLGQAGAEPGLLGGELAEAGVDGGLVVAAAADDREAGAVGTGACGRRRGRAGRLRPGAGGAAGRRGGRPAGGSAAAAAAGGGITGAGLAAGCLRRAAARALSRRASPGSSRRRRRACVLVRSLLRLSSKMDRPCWSLMVALPLPGIGWCVRSSVADPGTQPTPAR